MNLESQKNNNIVPVSVDMDMDFDFKPITSGLGFHHQNTTEIKPAFVQPTITKVPETRQLKKDNTVYQNDLSLFYGQQTQTITSPVIEKAERKTKSFKLATRVERASAYMLDLTLVLSFVSLVLTAMARAMEMDLLLAWSEYPHEITPLAVTLFCGFYLMYFSIFEKAPGSTLGKSLFNLNVVTRENTSVTYSSLFMRSVISLLNFVSLGLFSYFDLQNKVTHSKVVRVK